MASSISQRGPEDIESLSAKTVSHGTIDPTQIPNAHQIPPAGAQFLGVSPHGFVDVYCGTIVGDTDAQRSAKELLGTSPDTAGLSNADYVYTRVSALYKGVELPALLGHSGKSVASVVFVSGSSQGGYGAFHFPGSQTDFDRIVIDSLNNSGNYSSDSSLGFTAAHISTRQPHLFPMYRGAGELLAVLHAGDLRLRMARPEAIKTALLLAGQIRLALRTAVEHLNVSRMPVRTSSNRNNFSTRNEINPYHRLVNANQEILSLLDLIVGTGVSRQYLSTALFAAEIVECFQKMTGTADPGRTDGEALSRVIAFKLAPEIALVPGFNSLLTQQWWMDGSPDFVNVNSENDQSIDGNAAGVMFLLFLTDYLGLPMDQIIQHMPAKGGAPLGQTYEALLADNPNLAKIAGANGKLAFQKMTLLLRQSAQNPDGTLNLPADGNPFPSIPGSKQGGLSAISASNNGALHRNVQKTVSINAQLSQQVAALTNTLQQLQSDASTVRGLNGSQSVSVSSAKPLGAYRTPLPASLVAKLEQLVQVYRAPQYDLSLQQEFWPHVYNELPGTGPNTDRLQVITGTNQFPLAIQITGTIIRTKLEPDGDLHISFQPDDPGFPTNQGAGESPLELEIIYAGHVTQADAQQAEKGFTNPFEVAALQPGIRIQAAGPLVFDRAHGSPTPNGNGVQTGLEIHPIVGRSVLSSGVVTRTNGSTGQVSTGVSSALNQLSSLAQTFESLTSILREMQKENGLAH